MKKLRQAEEGAKAMSEYQAAAAAVLVKTERLRALRLAREAAERAAAEADPGRAKKTARRTIAKKRSTVRR